MLASSCLRAAGPGLCWARPACRRASRGLQSSGGVVWEAMARWVVVGRTRFCPLGVPLGASRCQQTRCHMQSDEEKLVASTSTASGFAHQGRGLVV